MEIDPEPTYNFNNNYVLILDLFGNYFLCFIAFTGCSVTLLLRYWITDNQRAKQLEKEHLKTEVEHLKQQVNPGFLYNTLHRIAQIGETNTTEASVTLMKFSKLLRYQLYDSNRNEVFLSSEILFVSDYLKLEQLYNKQLSYEINTQGDISCTLVPPLLFTPFIQLLISGIEHPDKYANLSLTFNVDEEKLLFTCVTDLPIESHNESFITIRQRLDFLFGKTYSLQVLPPPFIIPDGHIIALTLYFNEEV
nr:sensor histidine kinase [Bacteroides sp. 224]